MEKTNCMKFMEGCSDDEFIADLMNSVEKLHPLTLTKNQYFNVEREDLYYYAQDMAARAFIDRWVPYTEYEQLTEKDVLTCKAIHLFGTDIMKGHEGWPYERRIMSLYDIAEFLERNASIDIRIMLVFADGGTKGDDIDLSRLEYEKPGKYDLNFESPIQELADLNYVADCLRKEYLRADVNPAEEYNEFINDDQKYKRKLEYTYGRLDYIALHIQNRLILLHHDIDDLEEEEEDEEEIPE